MKYIMLLIEREDANVNVPIIFPDMMNHDNVAESIKHNLGMNHDIAETKVVSAGFITMNNTGVQCHGKSETLKIKSRGKEDSIIINTYDYMHGITS